MAPAERDDGPARRRPRAGARGAIGADAVRWDAVHDAVHQDAVQAADQVAREPAGGRVRREAVDTLDEAAQAQGEVADDGEVGVRRDRGRQRVAPDDQAAC